MLSSSLTASNMLVQGVLDLTNIFEQWIELNCTGTSALKMSISLFLYIVAVITQFQIDFIEPFVVTIYNRTDCLINTTKYG